MDLSVQRVHGTIVKPIVYGNYAEKLSRALPNNHSHKWKMFVRPFYDEDMSKYVRKVQFRLHESYSNPLRSKNFIAEMNICVNFSCRGSSI
jgi:YEATS domain-containing protein 4